LLLDYLEAGSGRVTRRTWQRTSRFIAGTAFTSGLGNWKSVDKCLSVGTGGSFLGSVFVYSALQAD